jgi:hypothetical protein
MGYRQLSAFLEGPLLHAHVPFHLPLVDGFLDVVDPNLGACTSTPVGVGIALASHRASFLVERGIISFYLSKLVGLTHASDSWLHEVGLNQYTEATLCGQHTLVFATKHSVWGTATILT